MENDIDLVLTKLTTIEKKISALQGEFKRQGLINSRWMTTEEASKYLHVSTQTIRRNAQHLKGKQHGQNGDWRFKKEYLDMYQTKIIL